MPAQRSNTHNPLMLRIISPPTTQVTQSTYVLHSSTSCHENIHHRSLFSFVTDNYVQPHHSCQLNIACTNKLRIGTADIGGRGKEMEIQVRYCSGLLPPPLLRMRKLVTLTSSREGNLTGKRTCLFTVHLNTQLVVLTA